MLSLTSPHGSTCSQNSGGQAAPVLRGEHVLPLRVGQNILIIADDLHGIGLRILTGKLAGTYTPSGEGKFLLP
ncbi:MAG: Site-specific recombinase [Actinomycetia bacterium]|nr:Site-specific recombinase [Actinomycetes bacterium]